MTLSRRLGIVTVSALIPLGLGVGAAQAAPTNSTPPCERGLTTAALIGGPGDDIVIGRGDDTLDALAPPCQGRFQAAVEDPHAALEEAGLED